MMTEYYNKEKLVPKEQVLSDMSVREFQSDRELAKQYYKKHYATQEEIEALEKQELEEFNFRVTFWAIFFSIVVIAGIFLLVRMI